MPPGNRSKASITLALVTVSVVLVASVAWWRTGKQHPNGTNDKDANGGETPFPPPGISPAVQHNFEECADRIRHVTNLSNENKLFLYALYKQATMGDAPDTFGAAQQSSSSWNILLAQAKYGAWRKLKGMSQTEAVFQYIALAEIHIEDDNTIMVDNTTGVPQVNLNTSSVASSDFDEEDDDDDDDAGGHSAQKGSSGGGGGGGGMMAMAVSRPMFSDEEDTAEPEDNSNEGIFLRAAAANDLVKVCALIDEHHPSSLNLNHKDHIGQSAMHLAADHGAMDVLEYLLTNHGKEMDVDSADDDGISILQAAVIAGQVEVCRLLLKHGANPDLPDDDGDTPRHCAADDGSEELKILFASTTPMQNGSTNGQ
mmetsp:Transcript_9312/g.17768  ORF Transcript_9312/g.17768 Transcript_9312/m.17768 type:complete len:369 (-) Transcript_9312:1392-2498(-)